MCGIVAAISTRGHHFNVNKIKLLACSNDHRGGDGVGMWLDNHQKLIKSTVEGNFSTFFKKQKVFGDNSTAKTCILHTRKASIGVKTEDNLHPYVLSKDFIFCHNGTLYNTEELLKLYPLDEDTTSKTDSFILGSIIKRYGYDVLGAYRGAAALVWTDNGGKTIKAFKGASLNKTDTIEEERPLHLLQTKEALYFNSLAEPLEIIRNEKDETIKTLSFNKVYEFKSNHILSATIIDRSKQYNFQEVKVIDYNYWGRSWDATPTVKNKEKINLTIPVTSNNSKGYNFTSKTQCFKLIDGYFYSLNGKKLNGVYKINSDKPIQLLQHASLPITFLNTREDYCLFYDGMYLDLDLISKNYFKDNIVTSSEVLKLKLGYSEYDIYSKLPIFIYNDYWYKGKLLIVDTGKKISIPFLKKDLYITNKIDFYIIDSVTSTEKIKEIMNSDFDSIIAIKLEKEKFLFDKDSLAYKDWLISKISVLMDINKCKIKELLELNQPFNLTSLDLIPFFDFNYDTSTITTLDAETYDLLAEIDDMYFNYFDKAELTEDEFLNYLKVVETQEGFLSDYLLTQIEIYIEQLGMSNEDDLDSSNPFNENFER